MPARPSGTHLTGGTAATRWGGYVGLCAWRPGRPRPVVTVGGPTYGPRVPDLTSRLRADLTAALRERDRAAAGVLRAVLAAIANAEAQPDTDERTVSERTDGPIAGAAQGLGAADVGRRELSVDDLRGIVAAERDERLAAASDLAARGADDAAAALRREAALLERYLA